MKDLRQLCGVVMLTCVFVVSASAGDMSAGVTAPPPPPPPSAATEGEIECGITASVLTLIESVLSVF